MTALGAVGLFIIALILLKWVVMPAAEILYFFTALIFCVGARLIEANGGKRRLS